MRRHKEQPTRYIFLDDKKLLDVDYLRKIYDDRKRVGAYCAGDYFDFFEEIDALKEKKEKLEEHKMQLEIPFELGQELYYCDVDNGTITERTVASVSIRLSVKLPTRYEIHFLDGTDGVWKKNVFGDKADAAKCILNLEE